MDTLTTKIKHTLSYTMVVPKRQNILKDMDGIAKHFEEHCKDYGLEYVKTSTNEFFHCRMITVKYLNREFDVSFYLEPLKKANIGHFQRYHKLNYSENEVLESEQFEGITVVMDYSKAQFHPIVCYHVQLKAMCSLIDNECIYIDFNTERILSGVWTKLQSKTNTPPAFKYLYTVQAVGSDTNDGKVWLHTHGLNRCGRIEFEIMDSNVELCDDHATILSNFCDWILANPTPIAERSPITIGKDLNDHKIVLTWLYWATANKQYDKNLIGGANYRDPYHNRFIGTIYALSSADSKELLPLSSIDTSNYKYAIKVLPETENVRISMLAKERFNFLRNWATLSSADAKVKVALPIHSQEANSEENTFEHIWCQLHKFDKQSIFCEVLDTPKFLTDVKRGDKIKVSLNNLSDWYLEVDNMQVTPDTVYQLVE